MFRSLRTLRSIPRLKDIALVLGKHGFHQVASSLHSPLTTRLRRIFKREPGHVIQQPERLRLVLEELGPTFIKFGQLLSTRPDWLPPAYLAELGKLQDEVRPAPFEEVRTILEGEFDGRLEERFRSIDPVPLAAASIAQVHRAVTVAGDDVVVKVRKKGLEKLVEQDLQVLQLLAEFLRGWPGLQLFDPEGVLRAFDRSIRRELNFDYERTNLLRLRENLAGDSSVYLPSAYAELSTSSVLTMEFLPGEKLSSYGSRKLPRERGEQCARSLALCLLKQIFEDGLFHADPHPGNIILMDDGRVGLIDVGNVGRMTPEMMDELIVLLVALVRRDYPSLARWILRQGKPKTDVDPQALAMDLIDQLDPYYGLSLEEVRVGDLLSALFSMVMRYGISVPAQYVMVGRTFMTVEASIRRFAPHIDLLPEIQPYVAKVMRSRWAPGRVARELETQLSEFLLALRKFPVTLGRPGAGRLRIESHPDLRQVERKLELIASRVPMALVLCATLLGSVAFLCVPETPGAGALTRILGLSGLAASFLMALRLFLR
ncbi:MAG: AarF/UbiB family protein [Planctomycetota bacterium]|nr:AarF/UbiB family protein [Planctomycetota bacterium]